MAEQRRVTLGSFAVPNPDIVRSTIQRPATEAHNFEIKPALVNLVSQNQFGGGPLDDPNLHISHFLALCDTVRIQGVPEETIRLVLFQFSLRDRALEWLRSLPSGSITTWQDCVTKFLTKFFPPSKIAKLRAEITSFKQRDQENFYEAWERYKELLRKCPQHSLPDWMQLQCFLNGLDANTRCIVDASAGGSINNKTIEEAKELMEIIAENHYQGRSERKIEAKGVYEVDTLTALLAQNKLMTQQITTLTKQMENLMPGEKQVFACSTCGNSHPEGECVVVDESCDQQCNYMGNFQQQPQQFPRGNFSNQAYNQNRQYQGGPWRRSGQFQSLQQGEGSGGPKKPSAIEIALEKLTSHTSAFVQQTTSFMEETRNNQKNTEASLKNLETQLGQLAKQVAERPVGRFPSSTEDPNSRGS